MNQYKVTWTHEDGESETARVNELNLRELIHQCLMRPSIRKFEVTKL